MEFLEAKPASASFIPEMIVTNAVGLVKTCHLEVFLEVLGSRGLGVLGALTETLQNTGRT